TRFRSGFIVARATWSIMQTAPQQRQARGGTGRLAACCNHREFTIGRSRVDTLMAIDCYLTEKKQDRSYSFVNAFSDSAGNTSTAGRGRMGSVFPIQPGELCRTTGESRVGSRVRLCRNRFAVP